MIDPISISQLLTGAALAALAAVISYTAKALTCSGAAAAFVLGTVVFGLGGLPWAILLLTFFITSSLWSFLFKNKKTRAQGNVVKGSQRDAGQVLANGGLAGAWVLVQHLIPGSLLPWMAFAAALAAANADTWATELGFFNPHPPRMIFTGRIVEPGTSGAVSPVGILAALAGSAFIGIAVLLVSPGEIADRGILFTVVTISGVLGSLVDSLLGATIQALYSCPNCGRETEKHPLHTCGTPTTLIRGCRWMTNDWVNFFCTFSASIFCILILIVIQ